MTKCIRMISLLIGIAILSVFVSCDLTSSIEESLKNGFESSGTPQSVTNLSVSPVYSKNAEGNVAVEAVLSWTPPKDTGAHPFEGYVVEYKEKESTSWVQVSPKKTDGGNTITDSLETWNSHSFTIKSGWSNSQRLRSGMRYEFRVIPVTKSGRGEFIEDDTTQEQGDENGDGEVGRTNELHIPIISLENLPPSPVMNPKVTKITADTIAIDWKNSQSRPHVDGRKIERYIVQYREFTSNQKMLASVESTEIDPLEWKEHERVGADKTESTIEKLNKGVTYEIRILGYDGKHKSMWGKQLRVTTETGLGVKETQEKETKESTNPKVPKKTPVKEKTLTVVKKNSAAPRKPSNVKVEFGYFHTRRQESDSAPMFKISWDTPDSRGMTVGEQSQSITGYRVEYSLGSNVDSKNLKREKVGLGKVTVEDTRTKWTFSITDDRVGQYAFRVIALVNTIESTPSDVVTTVIESEYPSTKTLTTDKEYFAYYRKETGNQVSDPSLLAGLIATGSVVKNDPDGTAYHALFDASDANAIKSEAGHTFWFKNIDKEKVFQATIYYDAKNNNKYSIKAAGNVNTDSIDSVSIRFTTDDPAEKLVVSVEYDKIDNEFIVIIGGVPPSHSLPHTYRVEYVFGSSWNNNGKHESISANRFPISIPMDSSPLIGAYTFRVIDKNARDIDSDPSDLVTAYIESKPYIHGRLTKSEKKDFSFYTQDTGYKAPDPSMLSSIKIDFSLGEQWKYGFKYYSNGNPIMYTSLALLLDGKKILSKIKSDKGYSFWFQAKDHLRKQNRRLVVVGIQAILYYDTNHKKYGMQVVRAAKKYGRQKSFDFKEYFNIHPFTVCTGSQESLDCQEYFNTHKSSKASKKDKDRRSLRPVVLFADDPDKDNEYPSYVFVKDVSLELIKK